MSFIRSSLRDQSTEPAPSRLTIARTPSSLRSKIHPGSEKYRSLSVASIGWRKPTPPEWRSADRSSRCIKPHYPTAGTATNAAES